MNLPISAFDNTYQLLSWDPTLVGPYSRYSTSSRLTRLTTTYLWTVYSAVYCDRTGVLQIMAATPDQRQSLVEQAQDELVCPICTDFFVRPRSLICLHSFCENCLVQLWRVTGEQETLTCPECRANTSLSDEAVAGKLVFVYPINRVKSHL